MASMQSHDIDDMPPDGTQRPMPLFQNHCLPLYITENIYFFSWHTFFTRLCTMSTHKRDERQLGIDEKYSRAECEKRKFISHN